MNAYQHREDCLRIIFTLDRRIWREHIVEPRIAEFESQFVGEYAEEHLEHILAIELLSRFTYFGEDEVKSLVRSLYRDHYRYPIIEAFREGNADTVDRSVIVEHFESALTETRFVPLGGSASSGELIAYYFRTKNNLPQSLFESPGTILGHSKAALSGIRRIVVLDDICGSGGTATRFMNQELAPIVERFLEFGLDKPSMTYLALCGTSDGLDSARTTAYERAEAAVFVDRTYRVCDSDSRYFGAKRNRHGDSIDLTEGATVLRGYGTTLFPSHPLGFRDGQLLIGFAHNIPNNSLPIMWSTAGSPSWTPPFERHGKNPTVATAAAGVPQ
jgi:hypothetical protein